MELTQHCLKNTYFIHNEQRYKQVEGAPMGSPLSPVIANLFMENLEEKALDTAAFKPKLWLRYVDDTFVIWQHGETHLNNFLDHLNTLHPKIKFTMEVETDNQLPFLDVLVKKKSDGSLSHTVYRKSTHTDRYLNATSHHHPAQLRSVVKTLVTRSQRLADPENIGEEMKKLRTALRQNGFKNQTINDSLKPRQTKPQDEKEKEKPASKAYLPYVKGTTDKISRILRRHKVETTFRTDRKISSILRNPKTKIALESQGVYEIPCLDCDQTYIGQTNRRVNVRKEEHQNSVRKNEKTSSLAQHVSATSHNIDFQNTKVLANIEHLKSRIIREAIEIEKRPDNMNSRDDTQRLPAAWKPALIKKQTYKKQRTNTTPPHQTQDLSSTTGPVTRRRTRNQPGATAHNDQGVYIRPAGTNTDIRITRSVSRKLSEKT